MADAELIFTRHAEDMLLERGIERHWVEMTVRNPQALEADPSRPGVVRAYRRIPERGGRTLRVAFIPAGSSLKVLTAFFDRRRR